MAQKLRERMGREQGFTLVELLVVMLILGLLAAIAIPAFFNQRDKARDSDAKASVRTAQTAIETFATENDGSYAAATTAELVKIEPTLSELGARLTVPTATATAYKVTVESATGRTFSIGHVSTGATTYSCTGNGNGSCPGSGFWN